MLEEISLGQCKDRLVHLQKVLKDCWVRFRREYLNELRQMNIYRKRKGSTRDLIIGDVVLVKDDEPAPRTQWRIGKVIQLVTGRDGQVRGATLKVLSKSGKQTTIHRPLQKLISFEIAENNVKEDKNVEHDEIAESTEGNETQHDSLRRSTRKAAVDGQNARRLRDKYY